METEIELARRAGQMSALKMILAAVLGRYAREFGDDAEDFILTITGALSATIADDQGDPASRAALEAFVDMVDEIEALALDRLNV